METSPETVNTEYPLFKLYLVMLQARCGDYKQAYACAVEALEHYSTEVVK